MNNYVLYEVEYIKGMLMYDYITQYNADNIIQAEHYFEKNGSIESNKQYVITIMKQ